MFAWAGFGQIASVAAQETIPAATPVVEIGAPVVVNGETLFRVVDPAGYDSVTDRANDISSNIERLIGNPFVTDTTLTIIDSEETTDVVVGNDILFTVTDADAEAAGMSRLELAQQDTASVQTAIDTGQVENSGLPLLQKLSILAAAIGIFLAIIWLVNRIFRWLYARLDPANERGWLPDRLTNTHFYQSGNFYRLLRGFLNVGRVITVLLLFFIYIPLVLEQFPQTEALGTRLLTPTNAALATVWDGFFNYLPQLIFIIVVGLITWGLIRLFRLLFSEIESGTIRLPRFEKEWSDMTFALVCILICAIALIVVLSTLPIGESRALAGVLAFTGLLITLSSTSAISNIIAGVVLTYTNAIHIGDVVSVGGVTGTVISKFILTTRVRTFKNEIITLPNSTVLSGSITNYSRLSEAKELVIHTAVTIGYDVPWQQVHTLLIAAALDAEGVEDTPSPFVLQQALGDFSVAYELNAYTNRPDVMPYLYSQLHQNIQDQFNAAGIEILSPVYSAVRDGNGLTLPPDYLPVGYEKPGFGQKGKAAETSPTDGT